MGSEKAQNHAQHAEWAVILGGSSGLGLACAQALARDGYNICVVFREPRARLSVLQSQGDEMRKSGIQVIQLNLDAASDHGRQQALAVLRSELSSQSRIKVLLHSIARGNLKPLRGSGLVSAAPFEAEKSFSAVPSCMQESRPAALTTEDYRLTIEAMGISLYSWVSELHCAELLSADTRVLGLTSEGARRVWPSYAAVSAAKATLEAITRAIAVELGPRGIRANVVQAGLTDTPSLRRMRDSEQLLSLGAKRNPLGRLTRPEDVASVVSLLCRPEAAWINGAVIPVDGGEHLC